MSRGIETSATGEAYLTELYALSADDPLLAFVEIAHADLGTSRYVRDYADVTSEGVGYTAAAFDLVLPDESEESAPQAKLTFDIVDQGLVDTLKTNLTARPAVCTIKLAFASDPDFTVYKAILNITSARWNAFQAELSLNSSPVLDEPYPGQRFSPSRFPGLFEKV